MNQESIISSLEITAKTYFSDGSHGWDHVERVRHLAHHIGQKESADLFLLDIAALLHDIGRKVEDEQKLLGNHSACHAEESAKMAREILKEYVEFTEVNINLIADAIICHRSRNDHIPQTTEAKVLFDADKLDSIGAVGIGRAFQFSGEIGAKLHDKDVCVENTKTHSKDDTAYREYLEIRQFISKKMFTNEGKIIAEERQAFMKEFFDRLNKEVDGEL